MLGLAEREYWNGLECIEAVEERDGGFGRGGKRGRGTTWEWSFFYTALGYLEY